MDPSQKVNPTIAEMLEKIILQNFPAAEKAAAKLEERYPNLETMAYQDLSINNVHHFWDALKRCRASTALSPQIQGQMAKIARVIDSAWECPKPVQNHWMKLLGPMGRESSLVNEWCHALVGMKSHLSLPILINSLGNGWLGKRKALNDESLNHGNYGDIVSYFAELGRVAGSKTNRVKMIAQHWSTIHAILAKIFVPNPSHKVLQSAAQIVTKEIAALKPGEHTFIPLGWVCRAAKASPLILANVEKVNDKEFYLRVLNPNPDFLHFTKDDHHHVPILEWGPLNADQYPQLQSVEFWTSLLESHIANLLFSLEDPLYYSEQFYLMITRLLDLNVNSRNMEFMDEVLKDKNLEKVKWYSNSMCYWDPMTDGPENKPLKKTVFQPSSLGYPQSRAHRWGSTARKSLDLACGVVLHRQKKSPIEYKLYKIEEKLLLLTHAYLQLKSGHVIHEHRRDILETILKEEHHLTGIMEKLASREDLTEAQLSDLKVYLATFLDWQVRFHRVAREMDSLTLTCPKPLYPKPVLPHSIFPKSNLSQISDRSMAGAFPIQTPIRLQNSLRSHLAHQNPLDAKQLHDTAFRLKEASRAAVLWKTRLRPMEWLASVYENIIKPLPLPSGDQSPWKPSPEADAKDTLQCMQALYQVSNLVVCHAYESEHLSLWHIISCAKIFRIQLELLQHFVPELKKHPISWVHLDKIFRHRGADFNRADLAVQVEDLAKSFHLLSPLGGQKGPVGKDNVYPLFDYNWQKLQKAETKPEQIPEVQLIQKIKKDPDNHWETRPSFTENHIRALKRMIDHLGLTAEESSREAKFADNLALMGFMLAADSAMLLQLACTEEPRINEDSQHDENQFLSGPEDHQLVHPICISNWKDEYTVRPTKYVGDTKSYYVNLYGVRVASYHKTHQIPRESPFYLAYQELVKCSTEESVAQADILKLKSLNGYPYNLYEWLLQAKGGTGLTTDHLLSFFETRQHLLLKDDARIFFLAVLSSSGILSKNLTEEPALLERFNAFFAQLLKKDNAHPDDPLHQDRLLWLAEVFQIVADASYYSRSRELTAAYTKFGASLVPQFVAALNYLMQKGGESNKSKAAMLRLTLQKLLPQNDSQAQELLVALFLQGTYHKQATKEDHLQFQSSQATSELSQTFFGQLNNPAFRDFFLQTVLNADEYAHVKNLPWLQCQHSEKLIELEALLREKIIEKKWFAQNLARRMKWSSSKDNSNAWWLKGYKNMIELADKDITAIKAEIKQIRETLFAQRNNCVVASYPLVSVYYGKGIIEIDLLRGLIYRDGNANLKFSLPVEMQTSPDLEPLKKLLNGCVAFKPELNLYQPTEEKHQHVFFQLHPPKASLKVDSQLPEYTLMSPEESSKFDLPSTLSKGFTLWQNSSPNNHKPPYVLCAHANDGKPVPVCTVDNCGVIRKGNLALAENRHFSETACFERLGFPREDLLVWIDGKGEIVEVDMPVAFGDLKPLSFVRTDDKRWKVKGQDFWLISFRDGLPQFLQEPIYLLLQNKSGQQFALFREMPIEAFRKKYYLKLGQVSWREILTEPATQKCVLYALEKDKKLRGSSSSDNLYLAYLLQQSCQFAQAAELLKRWINPVDRPYTIEELRILSWMIDHKDQDKIDDHAEASALRYYAIIQVHKHLRNYPIEAEIPEELIEFHSWFSKQKQDYIFRDKFIAKLSDSIVSGTRVSAPLKLESTTTVFDEEALLQFITIKNHCKSLNSTLRRLQGRVNIPVEPPKKILSIQVFEGGYKNVYYGENVQSEIANELFLEASLEHIPVEHFQFLTVPLSPFPLFRRAYYLLTRNEGLNEAETEEKNALTAYLDGMHQRNKDYLSEYKYFMEFYILEVNRARHLGWEILRLIREKTKDGNCTIEWPVLQPPLNLKVKTNYEAGPHVEAAKAFLKPLMEKLNAEPKALLKGYHKMMNKARRRFYSTDSFDLAVSETYEKALASGKIPPSLDEKLKAWRSRSERPKPPQDLVKLNSQFCTPIKDELRFTQVEIASALIKNPPAPGIAPVINQNLSAAEKKILEELNAFYLAKGKESFSLKRDPLFTGQLMGKAQKLAGIHENTAQQLEQEILQLANCLPDKNPAIQVAEALRQMHLKPALTIDQCIGLALSGRESIWKKANPHANPEQLQSLIFAYLMAKTEAQHYNRLSAQLKKCLDSNATDEDCTLAATIMMAERAYGYDAKHIVLLVHEYYADQRLRPEQRDLIDLLDSQPDMPGLTGRVVQLIMGAGKTKVLGPIMVVKNADSGYLSFFCVPNALYGTVKEDMAQILWDRFKRKIDVFTFRRELCDFKSLTTLAEKMMRAEDEGVILVTRPKDLHAFQLMLNERHELMRQMRDRMQEQLIEWAKLYYTPASAKAVVLKIINQKPIPPSHLPNGDVKAQIEKWKESVTHQNTLFKEWQEELDIIHPMLKALAYSSKILFDEFASIFDPRNQLSFPIGPRKGVNASGIEAGVSLYFDLLPEFENALRIESNEQSYVPKDKLEIVIAELAARIWNSTSAELGSSVSLETFLDYILSREHLSHTRRENVKKLYSILNEWNNGSNGIKHNLVQRLAFYKYCFYFGLKGALEATAHVNYGRSTQSTDFKLVIPYECSNTPKENTLFKKAWETLLKTCQFYRQCWNDPQQTKDLIALCLVETQQTGNTALETALSRLFPGVNLADLENPGLLAELTVKIDKALKDDKLKSAALPLVKFYLLSHLLPKQLKMDPIQQTSNPQDLGSLGASLQGFGGTWSYNETWPLSAQRLEKQASNGEITHTLLQPQNSRCHMVSGKLESLVQELRNKNVDSLAAIIDVGALFKGISNRSVAQRLLAAFPERKGILYYEQTSGGNSELALMTAEGFKIVGGTDPEKIKHILHQANVAAPITYYDQQHTIGSDIVQPPNSAALVLISDRVTKDDLLQGVMRMRRLLKGEQRVEFVIPSIIQRDTAWTVPAILAYTQEYQTNKEAKANFHGICEQMRHRIRLFIRKQMLLIDSSDKRQEYYNNMHAFLLELQNDDLFRDFGAIRKHRNTWEALKETARTMPAKMKIFNQETQNMLVHELGLILEFHRCNKTPLPEYVWEEEDFMGATQEVDMARDKQTMQEEENERMLASKVPIIEKSWKDILPNAIKPSIFGQCGNAKMPALFRLNDAMRDRKLPAVFDHNLLISENLIKTYKGQMNCLVTDDQKPIHHVLVVHHNFKELTVTLLTEEDARQIKQLLAKKQVPDCWLAEPNGTIIKNGSSRTPWANPFINDQFLGPHFNRQLKKMLVQALILQGDALHLGQEERAILPALKSWLALDPQLSKQVKDLFEQVLTYREDDSKTYEQNWNIRSCFLEQRPMLKRPAAIGMQIKPRQNV